MTIGGVVEPYTEEELVHIRQWAVIVPGGVQRLDSDEIARLLATIAARDEEIARLRQFADDHGAGITVNMRWKMDKDAAEARVAQLEAALREIADGPHTDTCEAMQPTRGCTCHVDDACTALKGTP